MPRIHTHYDNLKVTRNAPPEVIRAAYKTLCQKFHPDRNPNSASAEKTFLIIRSAYETLSDPEKRRLHDAWIAAAESADAIDYIAQTHAQKMGDNRESSTQQVRTSRQTKLWKYGFCLLISGLIIMSFFFL